MFTLGAFIALVVIGYAGSRAQRSDSSESIEHLTLQTRQDLRVIAYLLAAILVALGIIADRIH